MIEVLDHGYVKLIPRGCWGDDEIIIESARMSTSGSFRGWDQQCPKCEGNGRVFGSKTENTVTLGVHDCPNCHGTGTIPGDERLLRYLWEHKHYSPFEMGGLTVEVQAPIFVFREWHRHRTQSYNELSARYTELPDLFYTPSIERLMNGAQSTKNKQGSVSGFSSEEALQIRTTIEAGAEFARRRYTSLLDRGVAREIARILVPVGQYSRMRASANLRNWLAFLTLRDADGVQWETRQYAIAVSSMVRERFPRTWELWNEEQNGKG